MSIIEDYVATYFREEPRYFNSIFKHILSNNNNDLIIIIKELAKKIYKYDLLHGMEGKLYCLFNDSYKTKDNEIFYKLGHTFNSARRTGNYTTYYLNKSELIIESYIIPNSVMVELILFDL